MTYKSPLGRILVPAKTSRTEARHNIIPEVIRLPDGREFNVTELVAPRGRPEYYNLRSRMPRQTRTRAGQSKYSIEDRIWMADATIGQITEKWSVNESYARILKSQGRQIKIRLNR
jgi:hypothetical protein